MQTVKTPFATMTPTIQPDVTSGPAGERESAGRSWREHKPALCSTPRSQQALRHALSHDQLTGLPNAAHFREHLQRALERAGRGERDVMLLALDLDRFKRVNACAGHAAGDTAIREIAARICRVAGSGAIVARDHGDKFLLLLDRSLDCHAEVARALMQAVAAPLACAGTDLYLTCSIGIAMYGRDGDSAPDLLLAADRALERTPEGGLSIVDDAADQTHRAAVDRFRLAADLHRGLARGELQVHYQPQVDLASGKIAGFEALVRWPHPERGPIDPATLVAAAEECGLIDALGEWVLRTACAQVQEWRLPGSSTLRVGVNLSPRQFAREGLTGMVARALADTGLPPACLELELTESLLMADLERSTVALRELKQLGVRLSLDDFGTGYSSLSYLQHFPIDTLKIDRSFLRQVPETQQAAALVESIIGMGTRLGMRVIAEGVESEAQCHFLSRTTCDEVQGFFFSKALPPHQAAALLRDGRALPRHLLRSGGRQGTLLLVDGEPAIVAALTRLLRNEPYRILCAGTDQEAFAILGKEAVDVIMSDQRKAAAAGARFLCTVRQRYPHTVRMVLSGLSGFHGIADAVNAGGIFRFVAKPWDDDELRAHIRDAFAHWASLNDNHLWAMALQEKNQQLAATNRHLEARLALYPQRSTLPKSGR